MKYRLFGVFTLLAASCFGGNIWVDDVNGNIGQVNISTGAVTGFISTGVILTDIAFSPTGVLYGINFTELYSINTSTGAPTAIGPLDIASDDANALVFSSSGTLYTATVTGSLYTVNTGTGAATDVGSLGSGYGSGGDLAFVGGNLYLAVTSSTGTDDLVTVNTSTGAATLVGPFGVSVVYGLATPDNVTLYGVAGEDLYTVNLSTGAATYDTTWAGNSAGSGNANGEAFYTEAGAPSTPEPATLALFGVGFGLLGLRRLRKR
jgi:hypothetical protein